jgi:hypothetical protein
MAGVENKFECVYITKAAMLEYLEEIDEAFAEGHARAVEHGKTLGPKTAKRVVTTNPETDGATGRCHCGGCGKSIDPSDNFCRRCGARLED